MQELSAEKFAELLKEVSEKQATKKDKPNPNAIAQAIISENGMFYYGDNFFAFRNGRHILLDENHMKALVYQKIGQKYSRSLSSEIMDCIVAQSLVDAINTRRGVNCSNGVFDFETWGLIPSDPSFRFTTQLSATYNANADCPKWKQFLMDMLGDDPAKILILQEYMGYCLDYHLNIEKTMFFLGRGANGKSVICDVLKSVIGEGNYDTLSLDDLKNKFYLSELLGKLVNISTESEAKAETYEAVLKRLVSGEEIKVDQKFKNPFTFKSNCKHIYCLNNLPRVTDKTDAFFRRVIPIPFNHTVDKSNRILRLGAIIGEEEKSGVLNWCLQGYKRLRDRNFHFSESDQVEHLITEYRMENNNILTFVDECCVLGDHITPNTTIYGKYQTFCKENGVHPTGKHKFIKELIESYKLERCSHGRGEKRSRAIKGIRLLQDYELELEEISPLGD